MGRPKGESLPLPLRLLAFVAAASIALPIAALCWRADWGTFLTDIASPAAKDALRLSFVTATAATGICVLLGVPLAYYLANANSILAGAVRTGVNLPLVMPPLVGGLALLMLLGRQGLVGKPLAEATGILIPFTTPAVVIAQVFVALPFMVISVEGVLRTQSRDYAHVAASLGAGPFTVFWRVALPLARTGLVAGTVLTFARALGEFGATALFAGNRPGVTQTMPLAIYTAFNGGPVSSSAAVALALLLMMTAFAVMFLTRSWYPRRPK